MSDLKLSDLYTLQNANLCNGDTCGDPTDNPDFVAFCNLPVGTSPCTVAAGNHDHDHLYIKLSEKSAAHGVAALDSGGKIFYYQIPFGLTHDEVARGDHNHDGEYVKLTQLGAPNGVPTLDSNGKIWSHLLPADALIQGITEITYEMLPVGTVCGTVAAGDHLHDDRYSLLDHNHDSRYIKLSEKGADEGVTPLDCNGKVPLHHLPDEAVFNQNDLQLTVADLPIGTTCDTVASGCHDHDDRYYRENEIDDKFNDIIDNAAYGLNTIGKISRALCDNPNFCTDIQNQIATEVANVTLSANEILNQLKTVDGADSGLDADLLDGRQGSYYLDPANLTGEIPLGKLPASITDGTAECAERLCTPRTIQISGAANGSKVFDGSGNINIYTTFDETLLEASHNHDTSYLAINGTATDSIKLGGETKPYYEDAASIKTGVIDIARLPASITNGISAKATSLENPLTIEFGGTGDVTGTFTFSGDEGLIGNIPLTVTNYNHNHDTEYLAINGTAVNSTKLDNRDPSYYLDVANLTDPSGGKIDPSLLPTTGIQAATAECADRFCNPVTMNLGNDLSGSVSFDGSTSFTLNATVTNYTHNHDLEYLGINDTAKDSEKLDGQDPEYYLDVANLFSPVGGKISASLLPTTGIAADAADRLSAPQPFSIVGDAESLATPPDTFDGTSPFVFNVKVTQAEKLKTARTITLQEDVSGSFTFDGSVNKFVDVTVNRAAYSEGVRGIYNGNTETHNLQQLHDASLLLGTIPAAVMPTTGVSVDSAVEAGQLTTGRQINLDGNVTGSITSPASGVFDGTSNVTIDTTIDWSDIPTGVIPIDAIAGGGGGGLLDVTVTKTQQLETGRGINIDGQVVGSITNPATGVFDGTQNVTIDAVIDWTEVPDGSIPITLLAGGGGGGLLDVTVTKAQQWENPVSITFSNDATLTSPVSLDGSTSPVNFAIDVNHSSTADTLVTPRNFSVTSSDGLITSTPVSFDGSSNVAITTGIDWTKVPNGAIAIDALAGGGNLAVSVDSANKLTDPATFTFSDDIKLTNGNTTLVNPNDAQTFDGDGGPTVNFGIEVNQLTQNDGSKIPVDYVLNATPGIGSGSQFEAYFDSLSTVPSTGVVLDEVTTSPSFGSILSITYSSGNKKTIQYNPDGTIDLIRFYDTNGSSLMATQTINYNTISGFKAVAGSSWAYV